MGEANEQAPRARLRWAPILAALFCVACFALYLAGWLHAGGPTGAFSDFQAI